MSLRGRQIAVATSASKVPSASRPVASPQSPAPMRKALAAEASTGPGGASHKV